MIFLSAYNQEAEPSRIKRLNLLRKLIKYHSLQKKTGALHDHKGQLSVDWSEYPDKSFVQTIDDLWSAAFYEAEADHFYHGTPLPGRVGCSDSFPGIRSHARNRHA